MVDVLQCFDIVEYGCECEKTKPGLAGGCAGERGVPVCEVFADLESLNMATTMQYFTVRVFLLHQQKRR